ncbi:MAG: hypothetical protein IH596_08995 [Bacteroidales bacterium]|nr:hypothetical protein [Bacteroidales bacterium]
MKTKLIFLFLFIFLISPDAIFPYPWDGYAITGIRRLYRLELIMSGALQGTKPKAGMLKPLKSVKLNLVGEKGAMLNQLPAPDPDLQKALNSLFPNMDESYSITILDITPGKKIRYARRQENRGFMPGSVAKLAVMAGLFTELSKLYPDSFEKRQELMKNRMVRGGKWAVQDSHTVPFFDPKTKNSFKRAIQESDTFNLYEWADHMISASNNGAASVVWKEALLMRAFGRSYPPTPQQEADFFKNTPKATLSEMAVAVVNEPLQAIGITKDEFRLGSFFTGGAKAYIPGSGGSSGSPYGLIKYLIAMEQGKIVDEMSSLEMKRLMFTSDRRIRYASAGVLADAAVYFKSGSLYKCKPEEGYTCEKYMGNVDNYMNSVAIIEHDDGTIYLVALMSNVLKKNSSKDHYGLAAQIDRIIRK